MSNYLQIALTGVFTLIAAFGGAFYGNRAASRQALVARQEDARREQRAHAVQLLWAGREWVRHRENLALYLASPLLTIDDSQDTVTRFGPVYERYSQALSAAAIMIRDPELSAMADRVREHMQAKDPAMERLGVAKAKGSSGTPADLDAAVAVCDAHSACWMGSRRSRVGSSRTRSSERLAVSEHMSGTGCQGTWP